MQKRLFRTLLLLLLLAFVSTACGSNAEEATDPTATPETEVTTDESETTEEDSEPLVAEDGAMEEDEAMPELKTIAEVASDAGVFNTLLAALAEVGLDATFSDADAGPFTVFAPSDEAFAALPEGTLDALIADPDALLEVLQYHVVEGAVSSETAMGLETATTLGGKEISISTQNNGLVLNENSTVFQKDVEASNGVIHAIDAVLLPPSDDAMMEEDGEMMEDDESHSDDEMMEDDSMAMELPEDGLTIAEIAVSDDNFETLVAALSAAELVNVFSNAEGGPFTVFAPTDDAFAALPDGTLNDLLADPKGALTDILTYHVVEGAVFAEQVVTLDSATTLNGKDVTITVTDDGVLLNDTVMVVTTDILAKNGIIHVIDAVLLPPSDDAMMEEGDGEMMEEAATIAEIAAGDEATFSTLVAALDAAGLVPTFADKDAGPFTVFAPTNDAFAALPEGTLESLLEDPEGALTDILTYHVVEGAVLAETVVTLDSATTLGGKDVTITVTDDGVVLNDSVNVIMTDVKASNGVIHVIDAVLLPPSDDAMMEEGDGEMMEEAATIAEIAVADEATFSTLVAALDAAGLVPTFADKDAGPFTVFAPTNDAFAALPEGTLESLLADPEGALTDILTYHVVEGAVLAETVVTLDSATTLGGKDVTITVTDDGVVLNDSVNVIMTDVKASNGVIHVIDAVLLPPSDDAMMEEGDGEMMEEAATIAEIAVADEATFSTLVAALDAAGLVPTFSDKDAGPFTVFAPTNDAFAALPEGTLESLLADPEGALTNILTYHVVEGVVAAADVVALEQFTTLLGQDVHVTVTDDGVILNDTINIIITDIKASNGIIHVIDAVLIPAE